MKRNVLHVAVLAALTSLSVAHAGSISFAPVKVPTTEQEQRSIMASRSVTVNGKTSAIGYNTILRSGQKRGNGVFGQLFQKDGMPLKAEDNSDVISNDNDHSSLLTGEDGKLYMVSQFESRPGAVYVTELRQANDGKLNAVKTRYVSFAGVNGGWVHCAGSVTPWGTHLASEEYEPDAKQWTDGEVDEYNAAMAAYFGPDATAQADMNPYDYGYPVEIKVNNFNSVEVEKHYAMGRVAIELAYVMPDRKTAYISDDGTNVGLYRFVANKAGDLSAGTLWAAQWNQVSAEGMGSAKLNWISLGEATSAQVKTWIKKYTFTDIFDAVDPVSGACADGYTSINAGHADGAQQCLKLKDINMDGKVDGKDEVIASRLETRRWAAMEGATTEFRKMEGITFNPENMQLYIGMSEVDRGMLDNTRADKLGAAYTKYDMGGPNHMKIAKGNTCGGVYVLDLDGSYTAQNMYGLVAGKPMLKSWGAEEDSPDYDGHNKCSVNSLANPDNVTYMPGYNTLIIGEDTGDGHRNDMIWAYNLDSRKLTRIQTTPYGSETTSPYFYPNVNGFAYLMSVVQHPYGESDEDLLQEPGQARAYTGYIGPFPAMDK